MNFVEPDYVEWLLSNSMLEKARARAKLYAGQARLWMHPYAEARPRIACAASSVWFTAYPKSVVTAPGHSVIKTLGSDTLWRALSAIGIHGIHPGPTKIAGGVVGQDVTQTVDGNFDRIGFEIDPKFGTEEEFVAMTRMAAAHNAVVIDDVIPSHTGKGADFRLAELAYGDSTLASIIWWRSKRRTGISYPTWSRGVTQSICFPKR